MTDIQQDLVGNEKKEFLKKLLQQQSNIRTIKELPVTSMQTRLFLLQAKDPSSPNYNCGAVYKVNGIIDPKLLDAAYNIVLRKHIMLHSIFALKDNKVIAKIIEDPHDTLHFKKIPCDSVEHENDFISTFIKEKFDIAFKLEQFPLINAHLIQFSENSFLFAVIMHHMVIDGWSMEIFLRDLNDSYNQLIAGNTNLHENDDRALMKLAIQKYIKHENSEVELSHNLNFWQEELEDLPKPLHFSPNRHDSTIAIDRHEFELSETTSKYLRQIAASHDISLNSILFAIYAIFIWSKTSEYDIVVGTPVAGREDIHTHELIGFFANTLPVRVKINPSMTFISLCNTIFKKLCDTYSHQFISLDKLVTKLDIPRYDDELIFQTMFVFQPFKLNALSLNGSTSTCLWMETGRLPYDIILDVQDSYPSLKCTFKYNTAVFNNAEITHAMGEYLEIIKKIQNHQVKISDIKASYFDAQDHAFQQNISQILPKDLHLSVPQLFQMIAAKYPNHTAVISENSQLTYNELHYKSNALAKVLLEHKDHHNIRNIAVMLNDGIEKIISILSCLKANMVYIPLSYDDPEQRIYSIMSIVENTLLLTDKSKKQTLSNLNTPVLEYPIDNLEQHDLPILQQDISMNDPAYIIFTSGSTGQPKGVIVPHAAIVRLVKNTNYIQLNENDTILNASNFAFDAATFEIWGALLNGGCCAVLNKEQLLNPMVLKNFILKNNITTLFITTALFNKLIDSDMTIFDAVKTILFGGEKVNVSYIRNFCEFNNGKTKIIHVYGPTENTVFSTYHEVNRDELQHAETIPIGKPISYTYAYVLDDNQVPVNEGVVGELYLGGIGLSCGYINSQLETDKNFIQFKQKTLYKTSDLVYYKDGEIYFEKRKDRQIKLRGFRIELEDIESAIRKIQYVTNTLVLCNENQNGDKQLIAYIEVSNKTIVDEAEVSHQLKKLLPKYMMPHSYIIVPEFPLNKNGKIDKDKLIEQSQLLKSNEISQQSLSQPLNNIEIELLMIWKKILNNDTVNVTDNFFDVGGDSLQCIEMVILAEEKSIKLDIADIYECENLIKLAALVQEKSNG